MNRKILLVDEWRAVRLLGRRVLTSLGLQTREATTAREAIGRFWPSNPTSRLCLLEWRPEDRDCARRS